MAEPTYVIMPILANPEFTEQAIASVLRQSVPIRLLLINQGVDDDFRDHLERLAEEHDDRILLWSHQPPLPSLSATWNRALDFVWETGGEGALVVNNDVEIRIDTVAWLRRILDWTSALFVSAVGVRAEQFDPDEGLIFPEDPDADQPKLAKGGPDFSCFLISRACHERFRFDGAFTPAFCEDLDLHRRLLLAGEGARIFSVNLPFLHHSSATLKSVDSPERQRIEQAIEAGSRTYYRRKWGGDVNQETFLQPFGGGWSKPAKVTDGTATTPYLQAHPPSTDPLSSTIAPTMDKPIEPNLLYGTPDDGCGRAGGPDDDYRGVPRGQTT